MPPWRDLFSSSHAGSARPQQSASNQDINLPAPSRLHEHNDPAYSSLPPIRSTANQSTSPQRVRASHGRSISQTLHSTFGSRKRDTYEDSDYLSISNPAEGKHSGGSQYLGLSFGGEEEEESEHGRCATCDSKVKWPKGLADFRCGTCLMINDTKRPMNSGTKSSTRDYQTQRNGDRQEQSRDRRVSLNAESVSRIANYCIDSCLSTLSETRAVNNTQPQLPATPPAQTAQSQFDESGYFTIPANKTTGSPLKQYTPQGNSYSSENVANNSIFSALDSHIDLLPAQTAAERDKAHAAKALSLMRPREDSRTPERPTRRPPPPPPPSTLPVGNGNERRGGNDVGVNDARHIHPKGSSHKKDEALGWSSEQDKDREKIIKTIFKPLEDYIIEAFADYECINCAFSTKRPRPPISVRSEENTRPKHTEYLNIPTGSSTAVPEVDAKTLLLGDVAENGLWWTGKDRRTHSRSRQQPRHRSTDHIGTIVSSRSPHINWDDLNACYSTLLRVGEDWTSRQKSISAHASTSEPCDETEKAISLARLHVHKTILKSSESVLKRPGRPIKEPDDLRFLLILLADPLLYPPGSPPFSRSPAYVPINGGNSKTGSPTNNADASPSQPTIKKTGDSAWEKGHAYGVIKRVLGLLSNTPDECHKYLTAWLSKFDEQRFCALTDLILGFINHRMRRQSARKPSSNKAPTTSLIPTLSGSAADTSAQLNAAVGLGPTPHKKLDNKKSPPIYSDDWQIRAAARIMSLVFAANKKFYKNNHGEQSNSESAVASTVSRDHIKNHGQLLSTSYFYNSLVDYVDLVADFETWEHMPDKLSFCQFPFLLSVRAKIKILEHDARRQMDLKAREAFFDNLLKNKQLEQFITFRVRRECLVEDSLKSIGQVVGTGQDEFKKELKIEFIGEEGIDVGGLRKEWFLSLVREVFDPHHGMFSYDDESNFCYFNPHSFEASEQFHLVGALLGLAIYNGTILDVSLPPFLFKKLLSQSPLQHNKHIRSGMHLSLDDLAELHPRLAKGLRQLLEYDGDVESTFCRDFTIDVERYGTIARVPLGRDPNRLVTNSNRQEFVDLYIRYLLDTQVSRQFEPFKRGFFTVCGGNALSLFQPEEIELLVRGSDEPLDVLSLKAVATYENFRRGDNIIERPEDLPLIKWFWESFERANPKDQRLLLSFVTGSDRIPAAGVTNLSFKLGFAGKDHTRFPIARTCFNSILLYKYRDKDELERMLWTAVHESEGFGLK